MDKTITVIMLVYNTVKYLPFCIDSILVQTYKDFVLLLLDDGSTDGSGSICDNYKEKDTRIQVVHTRNQGRCLARSLAVSMVRSNYFTFVDSDDCVNYRFLEYMMQVMEQTGADIVSHLYRGFSENEEINIYEDIHFTDHDVKVFTRTEALEELCLRYRTSIVVPPKLYKTKVYNGVRYPNYKRNDDEWAVHQLFLNAEKVADLKARIYYYRFSCEGASRNFSLDDISGILAMLDRIKLLRANGYKTLAKNLWGGVHEKSIFFYQKCKECGLNPSSELHKIRPELRKAFRYSVKLKTDLYARKEMVVRWSFGYSFFLFDMLCKVFKMTLCQ